MQEITKIININNDRTHVVFLINRHNCDETNSYEYSSNTEDSFSALTFDVEYESETAVPSSDYCIISADISNYKEI